MSARPSSRPKKKRGSLDPSYYSRTDKSARDFRLHYRGVVASRFRQNVLLATLLCVTGGIVWNVALNPELLRALTISVAIAAIGGLLYLVSGVSSFEKLHTVVYTGAVVVTTLAVAYAISLFPEGFTIGIGGVVLAIVASSVFFPASPLVTACATGFAAVGSLALMMTQSPPTSLVVGHAVLLAMAAGLAVFQNARAQQREFEAFVALRRSEGERERTRALLDHITSMREERLGWLENLAGFLRHELKIQLVGVSTSIDMAESEAGGHPGQVYLDRARMSLDHMRALVMSATEATSLETALTSDNTHTVDWSAVVADRVLSFQHTHPERGYDLKLQPGLRLQGNESRLVQLLDKLLDNAREHSPDDGQIRVELARDEEWFDLAIENEGDSLPDNKDKIFHAFVSSHKGTHNLGLGLFVAQSIARNHGGVITAEDLPEGKGVRFMVRLPAAGRDAAEVDAITVAEQSLMRSA